MDAVLSILHIDKEDALKRFAKYFGVFMLSLALVIPLAGAAMGEEAKNRGEEDATLQDVVVTATGWRTTLDKVGGSAVTVITSEDMEAKKQMTVEEVIKGTLGVFISSAGVPGAQSDAAVRGADSKNTLVLVDGIMWNDPSGTNRGANLADLTVDNIERIEIVRGPLSVLYGSNATAGVINIITKKGEGDPSLTGGVEGGSYGTWKGWAGASGGADIFNFSIMAARTEVDGFSSANDDNDDIPHGGNTSEDDGWENTTVSAKFGFDFTPDFDINLVFRHYDAEVETDDWDYINGYPGDRFNSGPPTWQPTPDPDGLKKAKVKSDQTVAKVNVHNFFFDGFFESDLSVLASDLNRSGVNNDGNADYDYNGKTTEIAWKGALNFHDVNILSFGVSILKEEMSSDSSFISGESANTDSIWLQDQLFLMDSLVVVAGVRLDDHDEFGSKATYRFAPAYTFLQTGTTIKGSIGTGFRSPSLYELYSDYGNVDLDPETSKGWEIGFEQGLLEETLLFGATWFDLTFEDRIAWDFNRIIPGSFFPGGYDQVSGKTDTYGVEAFVEWSPITDLNLLLNYTYTKTEEPDGDPIDRRPENIVHFNSRYTLFHKLLLNLDLFWVDESKAIDSASDKNGNQVETLDSYTLVNLSASYDINDYFQVYGRVDNLFDEEYEEAWGYATPGLSGYLGVKFTY